MLFRTTGAVVSVLSGFSMVRMLGVPDTLLGFAALIVLVLTTELELPILWCVYSVMYWACKMSEEDSFALLVVSTLVFAAIIIFEEWAPIGIRNAHRAHIHTLQKILCILPVSCNNLLFHPWWGLFRFVLFSGVVYFKQREEAYILFAKIEAFLPLLLWHGVVHVVACRLNPVEVLPTTKAATTNGRNEVKFEKRHNEKADLDL
jgi:hypothetical protein